MSSSRRLFPLVLLLKMSHLPSGSLQGLNKIRGHRSSVGLSSGPGSRRSQEIVCGDLRKEGY